MKNEIADITNIIEIIESARNNAMKKVNAELIQMYWNVGKFLSLAAENSAFGDSYIDKISQEVHKAFPGIKGFNRRGLYRMKQFAGQKDIRAETSRVNCNTDDTRRVKDVRVWNKSCVRFRFAGAEQTTGSAGGYDFLGHDPVEHAASFSTEK